MNIIANYDKIIEENKKEHLAWIVEEFDLLFKGKNGKCSEQDKKTAEKIIDNIMTDINLLKNNDLFVVLSKTLQCIEQKFPEFF